MPPPQVCWWMALPILQTTGTDFVLGSCPMLTATPLLRTQGGILGKVGLISLHQFVEKSSMVLSSFSYLMHIGN